MEQVQAPPPFRTRLDVLFAAAAQRAVILRRGPKTHYRLIAWDLATDGFTCGQWMKGLVRLCDLSPNGRTLIYWAAQYHRSAVDQRLRGRLRIRARGNDDHVGVGYDPLKGGGAMAARKLVRRGRKVPRYLRAAVGTLPSASQENTGTWTAVSPVPYFSALAIWPAFGHWTGGGVFRSDSHIVLMEPQNRMTPIANVPIPEGIMIQSAQTVPWPDEGTPRSACGPQFDINMRDRSRRPDERGGCDRLEVALKAGGLRTI